MSDEHSRPETDGAGRAYAEGIPEAVVSDGSTPAKTLKDREQLQEAL